MREGDLTVEYLNSSRYFALTYLKVRYLKSGPLSFASSIFLINLAQFQPVSIDLRGWLGGFGGLAGHT